MNRICCGAAVLAMLTLMACGGDDVSADLCLEPIEITLETTRSSVDEPTGTVSIATTGGNGGLTYTIDQGAAHASNIFNELGVGSYTLLVEDREGCAATATFEIEEELMPSFEADISPIIKAKCATAGCHASGGSAPFTLLGFAEVSSRADAIKVSLEAGTTPPAGSTELTDLEIEMIIAWVDEGAQDN